MLSTEKEEHQKHPLTSIQLSFFNYKTSLEEISYDWLIFRFILYISSPFYQHNRISDVYFHCWSHRALLDYCSIRVLWIHKKNFSLSTEFNWSLKTKTQQRCEEQWSNLEIENEKVFLLSLYDEQIKWNRKCGKTPGKFSLCKQMWNFVPRWATKFFKFVSEAYIPDGNL